MSKPDALAVFYDKDTRAKLNSGRPPFCASCPIAYCTLGYVPPLVGTGNECIVGEAAGEDETLVSLPFVGGAGGWLNSLLRAAGLSRASFSVINTIGCRPPLNIYPGSSEWRFTSHDDARAAVRHCANNHLLPFIKGRKWSRVLALGNQALVALTPRSGINIWRGSPLPFKWDIEGGPRVIPTLHPAYLMRDSRLFSVCATKDFRMQPVAPPENYDLSPSIECVRKFKSKRFAFDFEWDMGTGEITLCGLTDRWFNAIVVPFVEPYIKELKRIFEDAEELIGHNIVGADTKYFERLGWNVKAQLIDTMLIQHLIQPDMLHGLGFVGSVFTNKVFWKGNGTESEDGAGRTYHRVQYKTYNQSDAIPIKDGGYGGCINHQEAYALYNARDTDASYQIAEALMPTLRRYEMEGVYNNVSVPIAYICRDMNDAGLALDKDNVVVTRKVYEEELKVFEAKMPDGLHPYIEYYDKQMKPPVPEDAPWRAKTKRCKGLVKDGTAHEPVVIVFTEPKSFPCPECGTWIQPGKMERCKVIKVPAEKLVRPWNSPQQLIKYAQQKGLKLKVKKSGAISTDKSARRAWGKVATEFLLVDQAKKLLTLRNSFAKEAFSTMDRVFFSLKVHGTSEGRLSCVGSRRGIDPNIQNQPKAIRKIFIPDDPSFGFLNIDIIQGENMITALLAKDTLRLTRLQTEGYDEHADMASRSFNITVVKGGENSEYRAPGKTVNHGMNYGLGPKTALEYIHEAGFSSITLADVQRMIHIWKVALNPQTAAWQERTTSLARKQGFLANVFGRKRWFQSGAYATKSLAFLPASTLADVVLRMMIALYPGRFEREITALRLSTTGILPDGWKMCIQVHDSLVFQGPAESWQDCADVVESVMTQPWAELGGFRFGVDIEWSGAGNSWGSCELVKSVKPWLN